MRGVNSSFHILNNEAKGRETWRLYAISLFNSTSIASVIFPQCTNSALIQSELQAGVCTALKEGYHG